LFADWVHGEGDPWIGTLVEDFPGSFDQFRAVHLSFLHAMSGPFLGCCGLKWGFSSLRDFSALSGTLASCSEVDLDLERVPPFEGFFTFLETWGLGLGPTRWKDGRTN